jgi:hypothetical protein
MDRFLARKNLRSALILSVLCLVIFASSFVAGWIYVS